MMLSHRVSQLLIAAVMLPAGAAHASPPNVVASDMYQSTAMGSYAMGASYSMANGNTAAGYGALYSVSGIHNSAFGAYGLTSTTSGSNNSALGYSALSFNSTGYANTALGTSALLYNNSGSTNTAIGMEALYLNATGSGNIAIGYQAGYNVGTGSNNIHVANAGAGTDSGTIRIGTSGTQRSTFIAGIAGTPLEGAAVVVTKGGQLGVLASSQRYKTAIAPMGDRTARMLRLRPVSFHLKSNPGGALQYGLIAEEVNKVYPELVIRDNSGTIQGVRYDELAPMLLNEVQQQARTLATQAAQLGELRAQLAELSAQNRNTQAALLDLQAAASRVARL
jgi:hypothetical protein